MTVLRVTQEVVMAVYNVDNPMLRVTQEVVLAVYSPVDPDIRVTKQIVEVLFIADLTDPLVSTILASGDKVKANLELPTLRANISATGSVVGAVVGLTHFTVNINAVGLVFSTLTESTTLAATINASGLVSSDVRENFKFLATSIVASGLLVGNINPIVRPGNSLFLTQTAVAEIVLNVSASNTLFLTQVVIEEGIFHHNVDFNATAFVTANLQVVLDTEAVTSTLVLTQSADYARLVESFLNLTQSAIGVVSFLPISAINTLSLTQQVSTAGSIYNLSVTSTLLLTQTAIRNQISDKTVTSVLNLKQSAIATPLNAKTFMIFQAPFELIQSSMVVPNPLLDDTENLVSNLTLRRAMNGDTYTYVKTSNNRVLKLTFTVDRLKGLEMEAFFDAYNGSNIRMQDWKGRIWKTQIITNPIDFVQTRRYAPGSDRTDVNLEFEGVKISG